MRTTFSMDQLELDLSYGIEFGGIRLFDSSATRDKKNVARRRWAILANALKKSTDETSVRRISSFALLSTRQLTAPQYDKAQVSKRTWFEYSLKVNGRAYSLHVAHRDRAFSAEDLMGFNNTGNVCIWPSEEALSYYACSNLNLFDSRRVLELGGGLSCLAGLYIAKYGNPKGVLVTDGNKTSIENVRVILQHNEFVCPTDCAVLKWGEPPSHAHEQYDIIISADCLFFDEARADFVNCLNAYLARDGLALVMAPQRGSTLNNFIRQSEATGLLCDKIVNYNQAIWDKRAALMENRDYVDDVHYPILIQVTKA
ncbi:calmodulin-lysine N-methyltransferase-like isoform X1 [Cylas formicarius]|uniref:calmodulin-lysine N-methyltransferase-like isoform X1 n=1 Tax=Cylas formicarius TaxID=197179 RepID=UPI00295897FC|nr:calmodulin-lysine N-methyltransferase-like isoform X1 [Cylas formicarius]